MATPIRVFLFALLLLVSPFLQVARCQSESEEQASLVTEVGDHETVYDESAGFGSGSFDPAPGVETAAVFPRNSARLVTAGEESELVVGLKNDGEANLDVVAIRASVHLPANHEWLIQNLTAQGFRNATVPAKTQGAFPYIFAVSQYLQPGSFDLVATVYYEIDQQPYQNTFYNGTVEVVEAGGLFNVEYVFLVTLGIGLVVLLGLWLHGRVQNLSKKPKKAPKVEVGTRSTDASLDEWLQGTALTQSVSSKPSKKKN